MTKIKFVAALRGMYQVLNAADTENRADWTKPADMEATRDLDKLIQKVLTPEEAAQFYDTL